MTESETKKEMESNSPVHDLNKKQEHKSPLIIIIVSAVIIFAVISSIFLLRHFRDTEEENPSSQPQLSANVENWCQMFYNGILDGTVTSDNTSGLSLELPAPDASAQERKVCADEMTVKDAILCYGNYELVKDKLPDMALDSNGALYMRGEIEQYGLTGNTDITFSENTKLGEIAAINKAYGTQYQKK